VWHTGWNTHYVRRFDQESLVANEVCDCAFQEDESLLGHMAVEIGTPIGMSLCENEREGRETIVGTIDVVAEFAGWTIERPHFIWLYYQI
jgi:hypothetical protein